MPAPFVSHNRRSLNSFLQGVLDIGMDTKGSGTFVSGVVCALIRQVFVSQQLLLFLREAELVLYILW